MIKHGPDDHFNAEEMAAFGFDSRNEDDRKEWVRTEPVDPEKPVSYQEDLHAYGSPSSGQQRSDTVE